MIRADAIGTPPRQNVPMSTADDPRWAQWETRDVKADGTFWVSSRRSGIYCRPSCPAKHAPREHMRLHATLADARATGGKACGRCLPEASSLHERNAEAIECAIRAIETSDDAPSLASLAAVAGMSSGYFHRLFRARTGMTPKAYTSARRAQRAQASLSAGASVTATVYDSGFQTNSRFYAASRSMLGMTPTRYRSGGEREEIRFALAQCSLGAVLVASSVVGVVAILMGDDPEALLQDVQRRFPKALFIGADPGYEGLVARVVGLIEAPGVGGVDLPLDLRGTAFQRRVWQALREVPAGSNLSYSELARRIGAPKAFRAVGMACAANPLAVAVPCHRVLKVDGSSWGYAWGLDRKAALLKREASVARNADGATSVTG